MAHTYIREEDVRDSSNDIFPDAPHLRTDHEAPIARAPVISGPGVRPDIRYSPLPTAERGEATRNFIQDPETKTQAHRFKVLN